MNEKIAIFLPDWFWSSIPYDGLPLYYELIKDFHVDLLIFKKDIRLNKSKRGKWEKFKFDCEEFRKIENLIMLEDWNEFFDISKNYKLILTTPNLAPKGRGSTNLVQKHIRNSIQCPVGLIDIGGTDFIIKRTLGDYFFTKGPIWKEWLVKCDINEKNVFSTGIPQYYNYYANEFNPKCSAPISEKNFYKKYQIPSNKKIIAIMPCNPGSHKEQFNSNINHFKVLANISKDEYVILIKTHPTDYLLHEKITGAYTGVYRRWYNSSQTQYNMLAEKVPGSIIVESQDHFALITYAEKMFNMSGSHVAWETYYTKCISYSINYEGQPYYNNNPARLKPFMIIPDSLLNVNVMEARDMFNKKLLPNKEACDKYFSKENPLENIRKAVKEILSR